MPNITDISLPGFNKIRSYEGRALRAYQDSVGVWTIGYGITNYDKGIGFKVGPGVTITADQAEELLYSSLRRNYLPEVERVLQFDRCPKPQGACDGGLSFHYNCGGIGRASWPKELMAGNMSGARVSFESWNKAGGHVLSGLTHRRADEWNIISRENYGQLSGPEEEGTRGQRIGTGELATHLPGQTQAADPTMLAALPLTQATEIVTGAIKDNGIPKAATPAPGVLKEGSTGPKVEEVQKSLTASGYPTPVTGTFDEDTTASVTKFQQAHPQLTADGTVGPATKAGLQRAQLMRDKTIKVAKVAPAVPLAAGGMWQWVSDNAGNIALGVGCTAVAVVVLYIVWHHRHELQASVNRLIGRVTI